MDSFSVVVFGFIQGITEFLPISSSGHLLLSRLLFIPYAQPLTTDVFLHAGSLLAIIWFFRQTLRQNLSRLVLPLIIGTLPAIVVGMIIYNHYQYIFETPQFLGISFLTTSFFLFLFSYLPNSKTSLIKINPKQSLTIGIFQALAIIPGISRSGSTIFAGKLSGLDQESSFKFAFLLAIPAIFGAITLIIKDIPTYQTEYIKTDIIGLASSFIASLLALRLLKHFLKSKNLTIFFFYTLILGSFCLGLFI